MLNVQASALTSRHAHSNTTTTQYAKFSPRPLEVNVLHALPAQHGAIVQLPLGAVRNAPTFFGAPAEQQEILSKADRQRYGVVDIAQAVTGPKPQLDFVLPGLLRGNIGAIVAPGGSSKGHFSIGLALACALGIDVCGGVFPAPSGLRRTLILQAEDDIPSLNHRVRVWLEHIYALPSIRKQFQTINQLAEAVQEKFQMCAIRSSTACLLDENNAPTKRLAKLRAVARNYDIIILDPLRRFFQGNENDSGSTTQFISALEKISGETGVSFLISHHANKASSSTASGLSANSIRGSSALTDALRFQLNMHAMTPSEAKECEIAPEAMHRFVRIGMTKCNHAAILPPAWAERLEGGVLQKVHLGPMSRKDSKVGSGREKKISAGAKFVEELFDDE